MVLVCGMDEAGRGPVVGPMTVGAVVWDSEELGLLDEIGVDDSKRINRSRRDRIAARVKSLAVEYNVSIVPAKMIDRLRRGMTLNEIEVVAFRACFNSLESRAGELYLDAADVVEERFGSSIASGVEHVPRKIVSKHKGDQIYKIVGAASLIAKSERDRLVDAISEKYGFDVGNGYPATPEARAFVKNSILVGDECPEIRWSWATVAKIRAQIDREDRYSR